MRKAWLLLLVACGGEDGPSRPRDAAVDSRPPIIVVDAPTDTTTQFVDAGGVCNPLTQAGCNPGDKCTWLLDAVTPSYVGHVGCAPAGTAQAGEACMFGAPGVTGFDNCAKGLVCGDYRGGVGACKKICDQQGGAPMCSASEACVTYQGLFSTGSTTPAAGGVCDVACDPLDGNDFDGNAPTLTRTNTTCGAAAVGCYGYPSFGTPPSTGFSCTSDIHYGSALVHRVQCTDVNGCADGNVLYVNSCSQGYLPLLRESSFVSTAVCIALCRPLPCYAGNCGTNDANQLGAAPHRCNDVDARGTFNTALGGEHCTFMWYFEVDDQGNFLRSPSSDTVGFCYDHTKYRYDANANGIVEQTDPPLPACAQLQPGTGSGTNPNDPLTYWGALDLGCVDSSQLPMAAGKQTIPVGKRRAFDGIRPLFMRTLAP